MRGGGRKLALWLCAGFPGIIALYILVKLCGG